MSQRSGIEGTDPERYCPKKPPITNGNREQASEALDAAIGEYTEAIRMNPEHTTAYLLRARAYEEKGDDVRAEADLVKARVLEAN